ncbi:hypothetical protein H5410_013557 [Solanum commersonii]|uniref:Uncharacterized protein n=1 Tax=Solanum commersonii TaxID=4109 RepID=A0A9J5ZNI5_SOLCO|nr:hypothetical protein H5410_013557 [Solanum commersonii]
MSSLLGSALPSNVGLPHANPDLVGLQCGYWTPGGKQKKMCLRQGCGLVVKEVVEKSEVSGSKFSRDKKTRGDSSYLP